MEDRTKETIDAAKHMPAYDATRINRAIERAARDPDFVNHAVAQLAGLTFPAFKHNILDHIRKNNDDKGEEGEDAIALFESLDGYIQFRDQYHVQKAFEENIPAKKKDYQITDNKRESPDVRVRETYANASIKDREAVSEREERKDYPEVSPTAMTNFICDTCHKQFQNQQDLIQHKQFESGTSAT
ncbi:MAG: C2H2-type zinc finger protein [Thermoproteota archaeon]|nr:C2H2-type zinc finger protein [Thermoproteota archaeon]